MPRAQPMSTTRLDPDRLVAVRATDVCQGTRSAVLERSRSLPLDHSISRHLLSGAASLAPLVAALQRLLA